MGVLAPADRPPRPGRVLLVVNPAARRGAGQRAVALAAFAAAGVRCDELLTREPGEGGAASAERHPDYDALFTLGGDGTAMEVVGALAGTGRPVGVLAGGTGNLIARTLGIPLDVRRAVPLLLDGDQARVDLGRIDDRYFAFAAGVGIDAEMIEGTPPALKRRLGVLAYALTAARAVLRHERFAVRVTVDGVTHEREAVAVMVANFGAVLNELISLGPGIRQDDGLLDLCVFSPVTHRDAMRIFWRLVRKQFDDDDPCLLYRAGRHFRVETVPDRPLQADGELLGVTPFEVAVEPLAATLLVPRTTTP